MTNKIEHISDERKDLFYRAYEQFLHLEREEQERRIRAHTKWPDEWPVDDILDVESALRRLKKQSHKVLVMCHAVLPVVTGHRLFCLPTVDVVYGPGRIVAPFGDKP